MFLPCVPVVDVLPLTNATFYGRCYCQCVRWNSHCRVGVLWQMLMPVVDGKTTKVDYFSFSSQVLNKTSSQTCGRWYLPTFLFRDESLTLMYRASLIVLIRFRSSLPTMLKLLMVTLWPVMLLWSYMGEGAFRCSLNLSPKVLEESPMYSSSHSTLSHWYLWMTPLLFCIGSLSLGDIRRFLIVVPPLKYTCTHIYFQIIRHTFSYTLYVYTKLVLYFFRTWWSQE